MITYESICEKLGFDAKEGPPETEYDEWRCDDHTPSVYAVLPYEELLWLSDNGYK